MDPLKRSGDGEGPRADEASRLLVDAVSEWYESKRQADGSVNRNVMAVGLIISEHLKSAFPLRDDAYLTRTQVKGLSGRRVAEILGRHGEARPFASEGGRTSRGTRELAVELASLVNGVGERGGLAGAGEGIRVEVAERMQLWFVEKIRVDWYARQRLDVDVDLRESTSRVLDRILRAAEAAGVNLGAVAHHLVGAKLQLRYEGEMEIENRPFTAADVQAEKPGDFLVNDTVFHVTVAPTEALFRDKCAQNLRDGLRPVVLVPERRLAAARQLAETAGIGHNVGVFPIEEFIGLNIDEMSRFSMSAARRHVARLLDVYNQRVRAVEPDPALQIRIPGHLRP